ncbi:amino acid adenylation domain-containing protein [Streptomyces sp. NPDC088760]|uniref:amino acid adenylation domain-containing protein n=1 Tax=Streptomyces sp. NPDC088760 TaxID=3365890 RepID=UPI00382AFD30
MSGPITGAGPLLDWLPGPDDPAPPGTYGPDESAGSHAGPSRIACPPHTGLPHVLAAWGALLYHHTGRRELPIRVLSSEAQDVVVRLTVDPGQSLAHLADTAMRALDAAQPSAADATPLPLCVDCRTEAPAASVPSGGLVLVLEDIGQGAVWGLRHDAAASRPDAVARHAQHLAAVLATAARSPQCLVKDLDPLSPTERAALLCGPDTASDYPKDSRVESLFAACAEAAGDHPAVVHGNTTLTYAELHRRSALLAESLLRDGLRPGEPVALLLPREPALVVAALAVLKAGGVYLPVDPDYPADRVSYLLKDSGAGLLLTTGRLVERLSEALGQAGTDRRVILVEEQDWSAQPAPETGSAGDADAAAYMMYTSGTTGRPKGVMVPHRGIVRLVRNVDYVRLDDTTRMAQLGATGFDASVWEIWGALLCGGTVHILDRETFLDVEELKRALEQQGITTAFITSALFHQLADEDPTAFRALRDLLVGGDVLSAKHARSVLHANPDLRLINMYGPTENVVFSTYEPVTEPVDDRVPIGRPVPRTTAYVLNQDRAVLPTGVPGELYVSGDGMALGYHGRPELTERAFVPDPFRPGRMLYRTGDKVRRLPDGRIDFLGRVDHQVKVRGFRVEPGEVEAALLTHPAVRAAVVLARRRPDSSDSYLCAYLSGDQTLVPEQVRDTVEAVLPPHMVPAHIVVLPALPLTANGKVDRAALPEPAQGGTATDEDGGRATDDVERALVDLWEDVLGVRGIGVRDTLDQLGGSSLTATRIAARVRQRFAVACPVSTVLAARSVAALAQYIRAADAAAPDAEGPCPGLAAERTPLSPQQKGIYIEQVKDPAATEYNLPITVDLSGPVDGERLRASLAVLVARHEILRTDIALNDDGTPYQRVHPELSVALDDVELPPGADPDAWTEQWIRAFDPHRGPLWRAALLRHGSGARLVLDVHHLLTDGYSLTLLMNEWAALIRGGQPAEAELSYRDFAHWANGPQGRRQAEAQRGFWTETFARPVTRLDLPTDLPRPPVRRTEGDYLPFAFGTERSLAVRELARTEGVTPFHVLLAVYTVFLGRVTGSEDVTVGTPVSGRHLPGTDRAQGMFVNTLCLRVRPSAGQSFRSYLAEVARHALAAVDHQDHPFDEVVALAGERDYSRHPLFDTLFAVQDTGLHQVDFLGGRPHWRPEATGRTIFDLNLQIDDAPEGYTARWAYATALFLRPTVEMFRDELLALTDAALATPDTSLAELGRAAPDDHTVPELALDFDF